MIRSATLDDVDALLALEQVCFETDQLTRRQFRYMLTRAHASLLVYENAGAPGAYVLILFNRGTSMARIYSIAVSPILRGQGVGRALVEAAETAAREEGRISLRLEIRRDNVASQALFRSLGYRQFGAVDDYYEDHMEALRFEKRLTPTLNVDQVPVPFYEQTLDFTCGPSSLMMAMKTLRPALALDRTLELRIWREATTIFMTSGHGGCGPFGLALSAWHRGFDVEVFVNEEAGFFTDSVRSRIKKDVIRLVQEDFLAELREQGVPLHLEPLDTAELRARFEAGGVPVVLISSWRIYGEKFPHWVVVTGFDERFVYVHDPFVDYAAGKTPLDSLNMPILLEEFAHMTRYGRAGLKAVLIVSRRETAHG
ncbi:GNAT family N-acetyltransferase/peptidase C39 family protein [Acidihalobacter ferrooxydans]|uniref:Ribosomal-protein-alanine acetyltransferase n=1 Tax=Acidihalobacter ferrooxydans TaxID=1765967 RepID=A0A1P8UEP0_9GAMM|nr:GNAT family N-acetyltransferase/peptidase C39 family protein [Acidihalobacter ferrooxydans]APZ42290.1 ribosomal-protein-alanine acetyltransferase [Acidihalobacter ferrooxydans]